MTPTRLRCALLLLPLLTGCPTRTVYDEDGGAGSGGIGTKGGQGGTAPGGRGGGAAGSGGASGAGGTPGSGGLTGTGGSAVTGGSSGTGGTAGQGAFNGTGGTAGEASHPTGGAGTGAAGTAGPGTGGTGGTAGHGGTAGSAARGGTGGAACTTCAIGQVCSAGACVCNATSCPNGCCSGNTCVAKNFQTDASNCGACGHACSSGQVCSAGACVCNAASCPNGCCSGNTCVAGSVQSGSACGSGGNTCSSCASGLTCSAGKCVCAAGLTSCGGPCVNLQTDVNNCGSCSAGCLDGLTCSGGKCVCSASTSNGVFCFLPGDTRGTCWKGACVLPAFFSGCNSAADCVPGGCSQPGGACLGTVDVAGQVSCTDPSTGWYVVCPASQGCSVFSASRAQPPFAYCGDGNGGTGAVTCDGPSDCPPGSDCCNFPGTGDNWHCAAQTQPGVIGSGCPTLGPGTQLPNLCDPLNPTANCPTNRSCVPSASTAQVVTFICQ